MSWTGRPMKVKITGYQACKEIQPSGSFHTRTRHSHGVGGGGMPHHFEENNHPMNSLVSLKLTIILGIISFCLAGHQKSSSQPKPATTQLARNKLYQKQTYKHPKLHNLLHKNRKKIVKITNGNWNKPWLKKKPHIKIALWNKATSNLSTDFEGFPMIRNSILSTKASIKAISEANKLRGKLVRRLANYHKSINWQTYK